MADSTKKKNYAKGSAKEFVFDNGGNVIHVDLKVSPDGKGFVGSVKNIIPNAAGYVKLTISKLKEPDQYGNTHSLYENDYVKPEGKAAPKAKTPLKAREIDDLPF